MQELSEWDSFYVIVSSAAGALIGLQFVVMTLLAERASPRMGEATAAFGTPTIVHFSFALFLAALLRAPWREIAVPSVLWGLMGLGGVVYSVLTVRRMHGQAAYEPEPEDWLFHAVLPIGSYAALVVSALAARGHLHRALFGAGGAILVLLFIGIHNAWDSVVYHVVVTRAQEKKE